MIHIRLMMAYQILIIDDDPMIRRLVGRMLHTKGYTTLEVDGGQEAINILKRQTFSHIILDLNMPSGLSGEETLKILNKTYPDIPIILSTGDGGIIDKDEFRRKGVSKFLNKPFDMQELFESLD